MRLLDTLLPFLPFGGGVIAIVGAGGKTRALFVLAEELSETGADVLLTTTTHIRDPRLEMGRRFDRVMLDRVYATPGNPLGAAPGNSPDVDPWIGLPGRGRRIVLASSEESSGKLKGVHPSRIAELQRPGAFILVEADGAGMRPIKAPAEWEPVVPPSTELVLGLVGLDCLGRPMDAATVHRPQCFEAITHCPFGAPIRLTHVAALALSPAGLFKGAPPEARRVLLLNKAERSPLAPEALLRSLPEECADRILVCCLQDPNPEGRILDGASPSPASGPCGGFPR